MAQDPQHRENCLIVGWPIQSKGADCPGFFLEASEAVENQAEAAEEA